MSVDAATIERTAAEHGAAVTVVDVTAGPTVTVYGLTLAPGVLPSRVERLRPSWELAIGRPVRLGGLDRGRLLVEVTNADRRTVYLSDVFDPDDHVAAPGVSVPPDLVVPLGMATDGAPVVRGLGELPHILVAGATGQGKSVLINAVLVALLAQASADRLGLLMVDVKRVELAPFADLPHLLAPVATDPADARRVLELAVSQMEARFAAMEREGVRHYRELADPPAPVVVVIDELADLMLTARKAVEPLIQRIAQKARAAGIHLLIGTQRPSVDVVTGIIKANIPTRLSFRTTSMTDSRVILDSNGAEALAGAGDGLVRLNGSTSLVRLQAPYVTADDVARAVAAHPPAAAAPQAPQVPTQRTNPPQVPVYTGLPSTSAQAVADGPVAALSPADELRMALIERTRREAELAPVLERVRRLEEAYATLADILTNITGKQVPPL